MSTPNDNKRQQLISKLKELFQLDQPDLDFGLYRIMHAKSAEITQFLEKDLLPQYYIKTSEYLQDYAFRRARIRCRQALVGLRQGALLRSGKERHALVRRAWAGHARPRRHAPCG